MREGFALRRWSAASHLRRPIVRPGCSTGERRDSGVSILRQGSAQGYHLQCTARRAVHPRSHPFPRRARGRSSYVNLLDGDAQTVAFTVATRDKMSVYRRLGGTRMALLMVLHPIRMARMVLQEHSEWLLEEWEGPRRAGPGG